MPATMTYGSPARAGIDLTQKLPPGRSGRFPRTRGDRPDIFTAGGKTIKVPRTRGDRPDLPAWTRTLMTVPPHARG